MYLYSGKIICANCNQRYRGKMQRSQKTYICSGYSNYGRDYCPRFVLKEGEITDFINKHFEYVYRYDFQKEKYLKKYGMYIPENYVSAIEVNGKEQKYKITYRDKSSDSIFDKNGNRIYIV